LLIEGKDKLNPKEKKHLGAVADFSLGSVHAITENGQVIVVSNTGSQLPSFAYSSLKVIWVVGVNKIVADFETGIKRIYEYIVPLETARMQKTHGPQFSTNVSKMLVVNKEIEKGRIQIVLVNEKLGF
jgi:hypothetical protein